MAAPLMAAPLLEVEDLTVSLKRAGGRVDIVDGVSFTIGENEPVGIVGESGSGKSMISLAIMGLLPPALRITRGRIRFAGRAIQDLRPAEMRRIRGREIAMVFQEPATALNPVFTTGRQVVEVLRRHEGIGEAQARARVVELYGLVGIPSPGARIDDYPHQMSGGMRQRVMIAMALACNPQAPDRRRADDGARRDHPAPDHRPPQAAADEIGLSILFVSHDLALVSRLRAADARYVCRPARRGRRHRRRRPDARPPLQRGAPTVRLRARGGD